MEKNDWMCLMLREKYNSEREKEKLWEKLKSIYNKKSGDIYMISRNINSGLSFYVFIREENQPELWQKLCKEKYFSETFEYQTISNKEVLDMTRGIECKRDTVRFGDIVKIKNGKYQKLFGIVLRETRSKKLNVGLKFCYGTICEEFDENNLETCGNIFKYLKINH